MPPPLCPLPGARLPPQIPSWPTLLVASFPSMGSRCMVRGRGNARGLKGRKEIREMSMLITRKCLCLSTAVSVPYKREMSLQKLLMSSEMYKLLISIIKVIIIVCKIVSTHNIYLHIKFTRNFKLFYRPQRLLSAVYTKIPFNFTSLFGKCIAVTGIVSM